MAHEMEGKPSYKDLEMHSNFTKGCVEDLNKELLLKASVKDLCQLLDQKVNVNDMNQTL